METYQKYVGDDEVTYYQKVTSVYENIDRSVLVARLAAATQLVSDLQSEINSLDSAPTVTHPS